MYYTDTVRSLVKVECLTFCTSRARKGTLTAQWEETLTFNERPSHFTRNKDVVIFFELLDFVSSGSVGGYAHKEQGQNKPWHRIAWAFLHPAGKTCRSKMGEKIRLQLYKYPKRVFGHSTEGTEVGMYSCAYTHQMLQSFQILPWQCLSKV